MVSRPLVWVWTGIILVSTLAGCDLAERFAQIAGDEPHPHDPAQQLPSPPLAPSAPPSAVAVPPSTAHGSNTQTAPKAPSLPQGMIEPIDPASPPHGASMSFAELATRSNPGVVFVRTIQSQRRGYRRVLGEGSGSGFIFDPNGRILTNYHVVKGAHAIQVELDDGRAFMAEVVGADPLTDLAVLQVPEKKLPALPFGDSNRIRVGDWVIAIGNPFGLEHTVSAGIISAKERTGRDVKLGEPDAYYSFLQTDASINPGNSGGPLLDLSGRVVGINTAINQSANNIGFAIPIEMIKELLPRLLKDGRVHRAAIGVQVDDVSREDVVKGKLVDRRGAFIARVVRGGPAQLGGVQPGDILVEFDGHAIATPEQLRWRASLAPIGKEVPLAVVRAGVRHKLLVKPAPLRAR